MDTNQWPQGIGLVKPILHESLPKPGGTETGGVVERKPRPQKEQAVNCPRCNSTNTKFCYYNNYSLTQPRYFCKTCRRYWTEGGTLRNVPVGGGSRKNKRSSISSTSSQQQNPPPPPSSSSVLQKLPDLSHLTSFSHPTSQNPKIHDGHDLNLAYPILNNPGSLIMNSSALELLKSGNSNGISPKSLSSFISIPNNISVSSNNNSSAFYSSSHHGLPPPMQDYKPKLNFCLEGFDDHQNGYGISSNNNNSSTAARLFLPYEDLKPISTNNLEQYDHHQQQQQQNQQQNRGQEGGESNGYWSGMLGGGSW